MITIYKIVGQEDGVIYYVGSTESFLKRKDAHIRELEKGIHANKKLQKAYDSGVRFMYLIEFECDKDKIKVNRFVMEYIVKSMLRPVCNKTFNMSQTRRCFNMKLIEQNLAERLYKDIVVQSL